MNLLPTEVPELITPEAPKATYRFSRLGLLLALGVITTCAVLVARTHSKPTKVKTAAVTPNRVLEIGARYAVGLKGFMQLVGSWNEALNAPILKDLSKYQGGEEDALRLAILRGWMSDQWPADPNLTALAVTNEMLRNDLETMHLLRDGKLPMTDPSWIKLKQRHGWMAQLARVQALAVDDPERRALVKGGMRTALVCILAAMFGLLVFALGLVVMFLAFSRWRAGSLTFTLKPVTKAEGGVMVEGFAIYLGLFLLAPTLLDFAPASALPWLRYAVGFVALGCGLVWPIWRGMGACEWHFALGLHRGKGWLREMHAGLLGWLAAVPILVLGMIAASWIADLTDVQPTHPIVDFFFGSPWVKWGAVLLAVIWAPVSEELMFRGLLFPGLSAWLRWFLGISMSAFIFAVIHPQGWAGVPAIMALAAVFSLLRQWRHSLIAPMTAHALNNGLICLLILLM